jgi:hypothetical protein
MKRYLLTFLFAVCTLAASSQRPAEGLWITVNVPVVFSEKWQMHNDASYRTLGSSAHALQYLYRPGIRYTLNNSASIAAGVAFFATRTSFSSNNTEFGKEFRTWQELLLQKQAAEKWQWQARVRTEQRFFRETSQKPAVNAHRLRLRGSIIRKLNDKWSVQLSEEYMRQLSAHRFDFDQNRIILTGNYRISTTAQLYAGYMYLLWPKASHQHIVTIGFQKNIAFHETNTHN